TDLGLTLAAMLMVTIGLGVRAVIDSPLVFLALSVLALLGMGIGNVVLPPLVKSYFPDRLALMSTVHVGLLQFGTFIPPLVAVPLSRRGRVAAPPPAPSGPGGRGGRRGRRRQRTRPAHAQQAGVGADDDDGADLIQQLHPLYLAADAADTLRVRCGLRRCDARP